MARLRLYQRFKRGRKVYPERDGKALRELNPTMANKCLEYLETLANEFGIDGWMDHVDGTLEYGENKAILLNKADADPIDSPFKSDRELGWSSRESKAEYIEEQIEKRKPENFDENGRQFREESSSSQVEQKGNITIESLEMPDSESASDENAGATDSRQEDSRRSKGRGDGYGSVTVPAETIDLLDRIKKELGLNSRRAAFEFILSRDDIRSIFKESSGQLWPEWENTMEASIEIDPFPVSEGGDVQDKSAGDDGGSIEPPAPDSETGDAMSW